MQDRTIIAIVAMIIICAIELIALSLGFNGTALKMSLTAIAGIGGFTFKGAVDKVSK